MGSREFEQRALSSGVGFICSWKISNATWWMDTDLDIWTLIGAGILFYLIEQVWCK
jgi:hypothetical protein